MSAPSAPLPVAVIGAGPVGPAAAAHLASRGLDFVVVEAGGSVASSVADWAHVRLFSPWRFNTDPAARTLLDGTGWTTPDPDGLPTGGDLITDYLAPLAAHPAIAPHLRIGVSVTTIARQGFDKVRTAGREDASFPLRLSDGSELLAAAVIDASGTWRSPNPVGGNGIPAHGEADARRAGRVYDGMPDVTGRLRSRFAGQTVAVVGAGHSATGTLLALAELAETEPGTTIHWLLRAQNPDRAYGGGEADALPARGAMGARVRGPCRRRTSDRPHWILRARGDRAGPGVGRWPQGGRRRHRERHRCPARTHTVGRAAARPRSDPRLDPGAGAVDRPERDSCSTVPPHGVDELAHPEPGFYIVGAKSYGRAPTFLLATGYEQVRSVVAALAGDWDAARDARLELPETGARASNLAVPGEDVDEAGCCGGTPAAAEPSRGLATGVTGGQASLPLVQVGAREAGGASCCG